MSIYDIHSNITTPHDIMGNVVTAYDIDGNPVDDYNVATTDYERAILSARNAWVSEARSDETVLPVIIHTDQHGKLTASNSLFPYLAKAVPWDVASACIGLGDVNDYSEAAYQRMEACLSAIPKNKRIDTWGNHDTWTANWKAGTEPPTAEEWAVLNKYFNNSQYNGNHRYNDHGIEYMIDEDRKIKYVVIGGWDFDVNLGGKAHYVINSNSMDYIVQMLSAQDEYDIVLLSHIQPFKNQTKESWTRPGVEDSSLNTNGGMEYVVEPVVFANDTSIDQMLIDRKNKASGTVKDSYGNYHTYDFTGCNSDLLCCFAGHDHCDKYMWQNENIPVYLFDAYAYDSRPFYFVNVDRTKKRLNIWKVDNTAMVYNFQIPFDAPS